MNRLGFALFLVLFMQKHGIYRGIVSIFFFVMLTLFPLACFSAATGFSLWLADFRNEAVLSGIDPSLLDKSLSQVTYLPRAIELDTKQPEKTKSFISYKKTILSTKRIQEGRRLYRTHLNLLKEIETEYGVPANVIIALWGIETHYGKTTGGYGVLDSLATLAYEGRRRDFFKKELISALKILQEGHTTQAQMKGSWAGAMGQNQFMPSSFIKFARDHNRDGRRDIWNSLSDIFASSANYLNQKGWQEGERWGREVKLSTNFDHRLIGLGITHPVNVWKKKGVTLPNGRPLPTSEIPASVIQPDGTGGGTYLVYPNYKVLMSWNRSTYFATTVGLLSDQIAQGGRSH